MRTAWSSKPKGIKQLYNPDPKIDSWANITGLKAIKQGILFNH
jgi:hypothetical protein